LTASGMPAVSIFSRRLWRSAPDRLQLLAQDLLALQLADRALDFVLDLRLQLEDLDLLTEEECQQPQPFEDVRRFQHVLLLLQRLIGRRGNQVRQVDGVVGLLHRRRDLRSDGGPRFDVFLIETLDGSQVGLQLEAFTDLVLDRLNLHLDEGLELGKARDARTLDAAHQHLDAGRRLAHPVDLRDGAHRVEILF